MKEITLHSSYKMVKEKISAKNFVKLMTQKVKGDILNPVPKLKDVLKLNHGTHLIRVINQEEAIITDYYLQKIFIKEIKAEIYILKQIK